MSAARLWAEITASRSRLLLWALVGLATVGAALFATRALSHPVANGKSEFWMLGVYNGVALLAALACFVRAARDRLERWSWFAFGMSLVLFISANLAFAQLYASGGKVPYPSIADILWLLTYPVSFTGLLLLARRRRSAVNLGLALDTLIGLAALAAVYATVVFERVLEGAEGYDTAALMTNVAYPIGDFVLVAIIISLLASSGVRLGVGLFALLVGNALFAAADGAYLVQNLEGTYVFGGTLEVGWMASAVLIAWAAALPMVRTREARPGLGRIAVPVLGACVGMGILLQQSLVNDAGSPVALGIAAATLVLVIARMTLNQFQVQRLLRSSEHEAHTDALTGLANRRSLLTDLAGRLAGGEPGHLAMFDLDGFKHYNDTYGHVAGDELLRRIARGLQHSSDPATTAYRLGGDEFCLLGDGVGLPAEAAVVAVAAAITQRGKGFKVTASHGFVSIPSEAGDSTEVLRLADRRMYAAKNSGRVSAGRQSADVLVAALAAQDPELGRHGHDVTDLAVTVGRRLGIDGTELDQLRSAAALHDIGKMAIPEQILNKPEGLDDEEWAFMRRHTLIGERIVAAAPALLSAAAIVRSSHEHWDGSGYPDGKQGDDISIEARIVLVCDAFDAMTGARPYRDPLAVDDALAELRRCSGTQFDPEVVVAFTEAFAEHETPAAEFVPPSAASNGVLPAAA